MYQTDEVLMAFVTSPATAHSDSTAEAMQCIQAALDNDAELLNKFSEDLSKILRGDMA